MENIFQKLHLSKINKFFEHIKAFNFHSFFATPSHHRTLTFLAVLILVLALPVTITVLQQQTQTQQHAMLTTSGGGGGSGGSGTCTENSSTQHNVCHGTSTCDRVITVDSCTKTATTSFRNCKQVPKVCGYCPTTLVTYQACKDGNPNSGYVCIENKNCYGTPSYTSCTVVPGQCGASKATICPQGSPSGSSCKASASQCGSGFTARTDAKCSDNKSVCCMPVSCTTRGGTCDKDQCLPGHALLSIGGVVVGGVCSGGPDFVCCSKTVSSVKYSCLNSNTITGGDGSVTNCDAGTTCSGSPITSTLGPGNAKTLLCKKPLPPAPGGSVRCGTDSNPGICYYYDQNAFFNFSCDSSAYTSDLSHACDSANYGALPSCDTIVKSATGKTGSVNISSGSTCQNSSGTPLPHGVCCSIPQSTITSAPSQDNSGCTAFEGTSDKTDLSCQSAAKSVRSSCKNPQNYRFVAAQFTSGVQTVPSQCIYNPSGISNTCTQNGGNCLVASSQGMTACSKIDTTHTDCPASTFCCASTAGTCKTNGDCTSGQVCTTTNGGTCANPAPSSKIYGSCGGSGEYRCTTVKPNDASIIYSGSVGSSANQCGKNTANKGLSGSVYCVCGIDGAKSCPLPVNGGGGGSSGGGGTPGPTCAPGKSTKFAMTIKLPGIGIGSFENPTPKNPTKLASLVVKDNAGSVITGNAQDFSHSLSHANGNGKLQVPQIDLGTKLTCGKTYHVEVKIPGYITIKKDITYGSTTQTLDVAESEITPGDIVSAGTNNMILPNGKIAGDDKVTIEDYNVYRTCHNVDPTTIIPFQNGTQTFNLKCGDLMNLFDYQDGGTQGDEWAFNYNLWLRGFLKFQGL